MTVTEIKQALGSWDLRLRPHTPRHILDALTPFGHIAVMPNHLNPVEYGDNLLSAARYVGVYRKRDAADEYLLSGSGMSFWLGDEDDKGDVIETPIVLTAQTFAATIAALLPASGAVTSGVIGSIAGTYSGTHQYQTPRKAITYVTDVFGGEWRVNGDGTLDAAVVADLYVTTPKSLMMRRQSGRDLKRTGIPGHMQLETNLADYTTRVLLLAEGEGGAISTGEADLGVVPYKDIHGNQVKMTRVVSESETGATNADTRAQLILNLFSSSRRTVSLTTDVYDVKGEFSVGDVIDVWDPDSGFIDVAREVYWEGQFINPIALRCVELTWPIAEGWTVAFRDVDGNWLDLSPYYAPEAGQTTVVVGAFDSSLVDVGSQPVDTRNPIGDSSVPAAPAFTGFSTGAYQSGTHRMTKSAIRAQWTTPLNQDSSTIVDGDHYEIRYRVNAVIGYEVPWDALDAAYDWDELGTWDALISDPITASPQWLTAFIGWGTNTFTIMELTPGVQYELQIRAVDSASPPNQGPWSASSFVLTVGDVIAPATPAVPVVIGNINSIMVKHTLGKSSGGTFNLEADLDHLEVHVGGSDSFFASTETKVGELIANDTMIKGEITAIGTFQVMQVDAVWVKVVAVDSDGNKSGASAGVEVTPGLVDTAHISDLSVSKLTAGIMTASVINAGRITTAEDGERAELNGDGLKLYDELNNVTAAIGEITPGDFGMALINSAGALTKLSDVIFGPSQDSDTSGGDRGSSSYGDLVDGSYGPEVTVLIGETGRCVVFFSCMITWSVTGTDIATVGGRVSYAVSGESTLVAHNTRSLAYEDTIDLPAGPYSRNGMYVCSGVDFLETLNPGLNTFTMKYADATSLTAGGATYQSRRIMVFPY